MKFFLRFVAADNLFSFLLYGLDKRKAEKGSWRVSEKTLLLSRLPFGVAGALAGMRFFHHKTRKPVFYLRNGAMLATQAFLCFYILNNL